MGSSGNTLYFILCDFQRPSLLLSHSSRQQEEIRWKSLRYKLFNQKRKHCTWKQSKKWELFTTSHSQADVCPLPWKLGLSFPRAAMKASTIRPPDSSFPQFYCWAEFHTIQAISSITWRLLSLETLAQCSLPSFGSWRLLERQPWCCRPNTDVFSVLF